MTTSTYETMDIAIGLFRIIPASALIKQMQAYVTILKCILIKGVKPEIEKKLFISFF